MRDPHIHVEKTPMPGFGHPAMRALSTEATGLAPDLPKTVGTGCGRRRPIARTSTCGGFRAACGPVPDPLLTWGSRRWLTLVVVGCDRLCDGPKTAQRPIGGRP